MEGSDAFLRRLERTAIVVCLAMAAIALAIAGGRPGPAVAVLAGGLLIGVSYWTIGLGVHGLLAGGNPSRMLGRVVLRYALLALLAYVMIARLRLHPLGLLAGASSVAAAATLEAGRLLLKKSRH
jgi:hypothetical protein